LRTLNGELVHRHDAFYQSTAPVHVAIPCQNPSGGSLAPGMYYLLIHYNNHRAIRKILVKG
jgi:hypothetical protein